MRFCVFGSCVWNQPCLGYELVLLFAGRVGAKCDKVCERYNPCSAGAIQCLDSIVSPNGYSCRCDIHHTGQYCEQSINQACPASWWGSPICGPCNCPKDRGFDPSCDKTTGQCNCRVGCDYLLSLESIVIEISTTYVQAELLAHCKWADYLPLFWWLTMQNADK